MKTELKISQKVLLVIYTSTTETVIIWKITENMGKREADKPPYLAWDM